MKIFTDSNGKRFRLFHRNELSAKRRNGLRDSDGPWLYEPASDEDEMGSWYDPGQCWWTGAKTPEECIAFANYMAEIDRKNREWFSQQRGGHPMGGVGN